MIVAVAPSAAVSSGRIAFALSGLADRGHRLVGPREASPGSPLSGRIEPMPRGVEAEVLVGEGSPWAAAWLAARARAQASVLALSAEHQRGWGLADRWAFDLSGAYGVVEEAEVDAFLAQLPTHAHERVAIWPRSAGGEAVTSPDTTLLERACERALARRRAGPERSALFLDRDGTLIAERHHLSDPAGVELLPGVAEALRSAAVAGHALVVVSNQAGVGRGLYREADAHATMARLRSLLRAEGVELDAVRFCPHAPEAGCPCRKPGALLLREAAADLRLSLPHSAMVGDKWIDVGAAHAVNALGAIVATGHGREELAAGVPGGARPADVVADDLAAAVEALLPRLE
jgi:histidinol-phosphate phosphatase family protein